MNKLLVICGPTATGKTSLALSLAKPLNAQIISADSRQVFKGLDIISGKDMPQKATYHYVNNQLKGYYSIGSTKVWGLDLVDPKSSFSVAQYSSITRKIINRIQKQDKLPILVGGSGLYISSITGNIQTINIPKNKVLRSQLINMSTSELFEQLAHLDAIKAANLNCSDKKNKRRLTRAIEIARSTKPVNKIRPIKPISNDILFIGLKATTSVLKKSIEKRMHKRILQNPQKELNSLHQKGVSHPHQSASAIGYKLWEQYLDNKINKKQLIEKWRQLESNYAKRQMVWFKKQPGILWFDISSKDYIKDIENTVQKWYSST